MTWKLIRQRYACAYEEGPRELPVTPTPLRLAAPALRPATVLACAVTDDPVIALTYDDGPDPSTTMPVLDALADAGVQATFFVLAEQVRAHPLVLRRAVADGHEIALHGWDHTRLTTLPFGEAMRAIRRARAFVEETAGVPVTLYRPAYGAQTRAMCLATRALGMDIVLWSAWARDWSTESTQILRDRAIDAAHPGGIMLLHDASTGVSPAAGSGFAGPGAQTDEVARVDEFPDQGPDGALDETRGDGTMPSFDRGALTAGLVAELGARGYDFLTVSQMRRRYPAGRMLWAERRAA